MRARPAARLACVLALPLAAALAVGGDRPTHAVSGRLELSPGTLAVVAVVFLISITIALPLYLRGRRRSPGGRHAARSRPPVGRSRSSAAGRAPARAPQRKKEPRLVPVVAVARAEVGAPMTSAASHPAATHVQPEVRASLDGPDGCEIRLWRGYTTAQFYAVVGGPGDDEWVIAVSPSFRWWRKGSPPEERDDVAASHTTLRAELRDAGWELVRTGGEWFASSLRREGVDGDRAE
jgi:hypothetical protein